MGKTENIGLNLTENESTSFSEWRKSIDGNNVIGEKSNMQLIDEAFGTIPLIANCSINFTKYIADGGVVETGAVIEKGIYRSFFNRVPVVDDVFGLHGRDDRRIFYLICKVTEFVDNYVSYEIIDYTLYHDGDLDKTVQEHTAVISKLKVPAFRDIIDVGPSGAITFPRNITSIVLFACVGLEANPETGIPERDIVGGFTSVRVVPVGKTLETSTGMITVSKNRIEWYNTTSSYIRIVFAEVYQ